MFDLTFDDIPNNGGVGPCQTKINCCNQILLVDDNPFNVKSLKLMLEHCLNLCADTVSYYFFVHIHIKIVSM